MKKRALFLIISVVLLSPLCSSQSVDDLKLWYKKPAAVWEEALPIGNGRLGAMIYGAPPVDHIQFNEETLWTGEPHDYSHQGAFRHLDRIRELLWQGRQKEAEDMAFREFMSDPVRQKKYQPFGDLWISFPGHLTVSDYRRELDLSTAVCKTTYRKGDTSFVREYIASYPGNMIVINLTADKKNALAFDVLMGSPHESKSIIATSDGYITMNVKVSEGVLTGCAMLEIKLRGGTITATGTTLRIENASEAMLKLVAATSFVNPRYVGGDPEAICSKHLSDIGRKPFKKIRSAHIADYSRYFSRFAINLGSSGKEGLPTDLRIREVEESMDNALAALYVQYGRYLLLASSREGTYPANLQGIWNDKLNPSWDSKYTVNINTEMNYWPAEPLNIAECHEALFRMLHEVVPSGEKTAREHYNARGWVLHHNTDLWRGAAPINASNHGIWVTGSGWLAHHFWEHYLFNPDRYFLASEAWPVMKGAAMFYVDFLVEDPATGRLISTPSNSPENGGLVAGPTMDHQIIKSLFKACIEASEILGSDKEFADTLRQMLPRIAPYRIGSFGQLQEWMEDKDDRNNKHRHVSHLWGVHPGKEINWKDNPELMEAAKVSLVARGDEGTGWSLAWKINFWARFRDGNHAWKMVRMLLRPQGQSKARNTGGGSSGGGSYPNLFDAHPPFQIDGNFGGAAGIVEMLIQSHLDAIDILPALPDVIPDGYINGVRARGGFELDFSWEGGKLQALRITSKSGNPLSIRYGDRFYSSDTKKGQVLKLNGDLQEM